MADNARARKQAVALRYKPGEDRAPTVVAKGAGPVAERILDLARAHGVPTRQDKNLVQVLSQLDVGQEIPPKVYQVVAEILAFIYRQSQRPPG